ncbi:MAG TPA: 16S rRNA (cytidine(1402)-2'-O)-methyltransferase, partial [Pseudomonadota bacterium]|nr:16S rRNA (cytidine(1402)-2'-O)-methyltransferase [Pseudomonadota bacterium]
MSTQAGKSPRGPRPAGRLFVVATPIGNMEDITLRALRVLGEVPIIAAEDTRAAGHLLNHHRVRAGTGPAKLVSFFVGNESARTQELLAALGDGQDVAIISEAGLPGIADPGQRLIAAARAAGVRVEVVPGPCAALTALSGSGLPSERFVFLGFLPRNESHQLSLLSRLRGEVGTLIFYESPERVASTLRTLATVLGGERPACLARELTKLYEEYVQGSLAELAERYRDGGVRGEVTLLVGGAAPDPATAGTGEGIATTAQTLASIEASIRERLQQGQGPKDISTALAVT